MDSLDVAGQVVALAVEQTVGLSTDAERRLDAVKPDLVVLGDVAVIEGQRKSRMVADAEAELVLDGVFDGQRVVDGLPLQREGGAQHEGIRPFGQRLGVRVQLKLQQIVGVMGHRVLDIAGKAVLTACVLHTLGQHFAAGQLACVRKKNRRMTFPDRRVGLPEQLGPGGLMDDTDRLGTVGVDSQAQNVVFNTVLHGESSFLNIQIV